MVCFLSDVEVGMTQEAALQAVRCDPTSVDHYVSRGEKTISWYFTGTRNYGDGGFVRFDADGRVEQVSWN